MALAMESRAFGMSNKNRYLKPIKFSLKDKIVLVVLLIICALMFYTYILGYGKL
jgi:energy-coupling factor transporter transmembrane protein EcfT